MKTGLFVCLLFVVRISLAQLENIPLITVIGESTIKVKPDYVILGVKISKKLSNDPRFRNSFEIFKEEDVKIRLFNFDLKNESVSIIQSENSEYFKEVFIEIYDLQKLDRYMLELFNLGISDFIMVDYRVQNYADFKARVYKEAVIDAKKKAVGIAGQLGQDIGAAHIIEEIPTETYNWYHISDKKNARNVTFKSGSADYLVEPGYIVITSRIKVSFDLLKSNDATLSE